jgi:hypothetical protein
MKYQNKSFIAVAGKVAAIHDEIEKLKELYLGSYGNKTIKLSGEFTTQYLNCTFNLNLVLT